MKQILDGLWSMFTARDLGAFFSGLILLLVGILLAPFMLVAGLLGIGL